jgi:hypothetical protein
MTASVFIKKNPPENTVFNNMMQTLELTEVWKFLKENNIGEYSVRYAADGVHIDFEQGGDAMLVGVRFGSQ